MSDRVLARGISILDQIATEKLTEAMTPSAALVLHQITTDELHRARLTPREIVPDLLFADVRTRISAGGIGKTTLALFEAASLALGKSLWGRRPERPGRTVIVTREDSREILVARLREILSAMALEGHSIDQAIKNLLILDLIETDFKLCQIMNDVVRPHWQHIDLLCAALEPWQPDWVIFDPLVSFGVGESRINDAEQGLIEAFRLIRTRLNCCVEGIHHSGKANAREKTTDQYTGRGGSALADGCRMVAVLQPLSDKEWYMATGIPLQTGESGLVMALPKLSFVSPQAPIYIKRAGFAFAMVNTAPQSSEQVAAAAAQLVLDFLGREYQLGHRYSKHDLDQQIDLLHLTRAQMRQAIFSLMQSGRVVYYQVKGKPGSHFVPIGDSVATVPPGAEHAQAQTTFAAL